jgi:hypothetical protein
MEYMDLQGYSQMNLISCVIAADNHKSFKLRLPSLRRDLCRRMLSRGGGSLIPDVESVPVSPEGDGHSDAADVSMLSASAFGRLLVNNPKGLSTGVESLTPLNHQPLISDHDIISVVHHEVGGQVLMSSSPQPKPPTQLKLKRNASQGSLVNHALTESAMPLSDPRLLRTTSHGMASFDHELISPSKRLDRDTHNVMLSSAMQGYLLPPANVKHNVTEKVAQV